MKHFVLSALLSFTVLISQAYANPDIWKIEGWGNTDFSKSSIDFKEVLSGGPPKDGIPSIDRPEFRTAAGIEGLEEHEPVLSLTVNGQTKAYPVRILTWHEIVNDVIGGVPVAITYCPLCNASVVFERTIDGDVTEFGVSGKLRHSDMIMYDRKTDSWWQQFTGEAIVGSRLGTKLKILPSRTESWSRFVERHPEADVLVPNNIHLRQYGSNPYVRYDTSNRPFLFRGEFPEGIAPLAYVVSVKDGDKPFVVSLQKLRDEKTLTREGITLTWTDGTRSALDARQISEGRQIGNVIAKRGDEDIPYDLTFAFVTHAFMPDVPIEQ
ncbi:DUF3179 domain-containing protein [Lentilitoribacter sp. EG35]|jgi:hypothetical protein|uniref:DUF3179 domain-containing protein n=1 Tax=Lentilitoribacter sp. EG35 TaxID=3234192 RepID=UPI0034616C9E